MPGRCCAPEWGLPWGGAVYRTLTGQPLELRRKGQRCRWYALDNGAQVGPEQENVAPAIAYAQSQAWTPMTPDQIQVWREKWGAQIGHTAD